MSWPSVRRSVRAAADALSLNARRAPGCGPLERQAMVMTSCRQLSLSPAVCFSFRAFRLAPVSSTPHIDRFAVGRLSAACLPKHRPLIIRCSTSVVNCRRRTYWTDRSVHARSRYNGRPCHIYVLDADRKYDASAPNAWRFLPGNYLSTSSSSSAATAVAAAAGRVIAPSSHLITSHSYHYLSSSSLLFRPTARRWRQMKSADTVARCSLCVCCTLRWLTAWLNDGYLLQPRIPVWCMIPSQPDRY